MVTKTFIGVENTSREILEEIKFTIHKLTNRPRPQDINRRLIICCFSEFGCETVGSMYCVPKLARQHPGDYKIVIGWYGRKYLYQHLVDEFWELDEDHQHLREYTRAFHHESKNLSQLESRLAQYGKVVPSDYLGKIVIGNMCRDCRNFWGGYEDIVSCPNCESLNLDKSLFSDIKTAREKSTSIPRPSVEKLKIAGGIVGKNAVAITGRGRKTYGRNLQPEFYVKLISMLREKGYDPIWIGEKQSTQECPVKDVIDFSRDERSRDLELTLAIISKCEFTIQFWTASTRLAAMVGVPYVLVESPDQIIGNGQEGYRIALIGGKRKVIFSHYLSVFNNHKDSIKLIEQAMSEMNEDNWDCLVGLVEDKEHIGNLSNSNLRRIGWME